jgi:hypothetical protein
LSDVPDQASSHHQPARAWLGRLSTFIVGVAGGMAVNDVSGTLGYHGLAGVIALFFWGGQRPGYEGWTPAHGCLGTRHGCSWCLRAAQRL